MSPAATWQRTKRTKAGAIMETVREGETLTLRIRCAHCGILVRETVFDLRLAPPWTGEEQAQEDTAAFRSHRCLS